jgi:hypothetical protein
MRSRLCLLVAGVTLVVGSAFAQAPAAPLDSVQGETTPDAPPQNLSEKLKRSNDVIHPKEVDPAIEKPAPKAGDPNVVSGVRLHRLAGRSVRTWGAEPRLVEHYGLEGPGMADRGDVSLGDGVS